MTHGAQDEEFGVEWRRLQAAQLELRRSLAAATDDDQRAQLRAELASGKERLARLEAQRAAATGSSGGSGSATGQSKGDQGTGAAAPAAEAAPPPEIGRPAATAGPAAEVSASAATPAEDSEIDELLEELVFRHQRPPPRPASVERPRGPGEPPGPGGSGGPPAATTTSGAGRRRWSQLQPGVLVAGVVVIAVTVVGLIAGVAAVFWSLGARDDSTATEAVGDSVVALTDQGSTGLGGGVDEVRQTLAALGLSEVEAELEGSVLRLAGTVATDADRRSAIDAARASVGDVAIDAEALRVITTPPPPTLQVALVAPGARDDMAFTQSMADALDVISEERGGIELTVADNIGGADAAATINGFAIERYDLVIAHSSTFRALVSTIAEEHPDVMFAVGPVDGEPERSNVYTYGVAADEGGFVLGALAARMSASGVVGAIGPVEAGVSKRFIDAFRTGAETERPDTAVIVQYTGAFADAGAAAAATEELLTLGADVIVGQGHDMERAILTASDGGALWFGNQVDQSAVDDSVVASQVYHWEVVLERIIDDIDRGVVAGSNHRADIANGGLVIAVSSDHRLISRDRARLDELLAGFGLSSSAN